jgi:hypothetical protein
MEVAAPPTGTVTGLGRLTLTPAGVAPTQASDNATCELKPLTDEIVNETDRKPPGLKLSVAEEGCAVKSGETDATTVPAGETVKVRVVEWDIGPLETVTVSGYLPTATVPGTKMNSVAEAVPPEVVVIESVPEEAVPGFALNVPVTPVGPDKESTTGEAKLACEPTNTVRLPVDPCAIVKPVVESPSEKSPEYSMNPHELAWQTPLE